MLGSVNTNTLRAVFILSFQIFCSIGGIIFYANHNHWIGPVSSTFIGGNGVVFSIILLPFQLAALLAPDKELSMFYGDSDFFGLRFSAMFNLTVMAVTGIFLYHGVTFLIAASNGIGFIAVDRNELVDAYSLRIDSAILLSSAAFNVFFLFFSVPRSFRDG